MISASMLVLEYDMVMVSTGLHYEYSIRVRVGAMEVFIHHVKHSIMLDSDMVALEKQSNLS